MPGGGDIYQLPGGNPNSVWAAFGQSNPFENFPDIDLDWKEAWTEVYTTANDAYQSGQRVDVGDVMTTTIRGVLELVPMLGTAMNALENLLASPDSPPRVLVWNNRTDRAIWLYNQALLGNKVHPDMVNWAIPEASRWNEQHGTWEVRHPLHWSMPWKLPKYGDKFTFDPFWLKNVHGGDSEAAGRDYAQRLEFLQEMKSKGKGTSIESAPWTIVIIAAAMLLLKK